MQLQLQPRGLRLTNPKASVELPRRFPPPCPLPARQRPLGGLRMEGCGVALCPEEMCLLGLPWPS